MHTRGPVISGVMALLLVGSIGFSASIPPPEPHDKEGSSSSSKPAGEVGPEAQTDPDPYLGRVAFEVAEGLRGMPAMEVTLDGLKAPRITVVPGEPGVGLLPTQTLPPGLYGLLVTYRGSPWFTVVVPEIWVESGKTTLCALDTGIRLPSPGEAAVSGWDLLPHGEERPVLRVRRPAEGADPLWSPFALQPGTYDLRILREGVAEPETVREGLEIPRGKIVEIRLDL